MLQFMSLLAVSLIAFGELLLILRMRSRLNRLRTREGRVNRILGPNVDPKHWSGDRR